MVDRVRLNKYLAKAGVASRRASDQMVADGRVTLNGAVARIGDCVLPGDVVMLDGAVVGDDGSVVILAFNKPRGIICTANRDVPNNIIDFIGYPRRVFTIGRLDKDSEGLILLTNDGDLANKIMKSRYGHEKEYLVAVDKDVTDDFVKGLEGGVDIGEGRITRECDVTVEDARVIRIVLRQGLNRQIRRMCDHFGYNVVRLVRVRVMNIRLGKLKEGAYREINKRERQALLNLAEDSALADKDG